ncbi:quinol dehydrogenase ferredoxin subunit NapH [Sphaerotilus microaerophilus]|uniref:Ferredoxin-type protein NapH n=1 Tax=Sphaerotilus microaerophilus TaxID=2914710 RepID=A0ABN6PUA5_9BURK|nr:quinol dehydrogenase ferredoxin subunit NapH [Sphaerotilus sp. FB-5]BDI07669.1 ferredoxin-type protein NapH [Sphaerotilus sp. FB-5]
MSAAKFPATKPTAIKPRIGAEALEAKGWWATHRLLIARRTSQLGILLLFLAGPWFGWWIVKGNLASSLTLGVLPLTDPYVFLQSLLAGKAPQRTALIGTLIVLAFYLLVGGRSFCSWVCPINPVTDLAAWLRQRYGIRGSARVSRNLRYALLAMTGVVALVTGSIAWELVNPVSMLQRGLIFGLGATWAVVLAIFLFDLFVMQRGWCGHLCPVGAFYSLIGRASVLRVAATRREACNDCADCYAICPEPLVIKPALKGVAGAGPVITAPECTNCGRCIDICSKDVFHYGSRWASSPDGAGTRHIPIQPVGSGTTGGR